MTMAAVQTIGPIERAVLLRALPIFDGVRTGQLAALAQLTDERTAYAGQVLLAAGARVPGLAVLIDGAARVERNGSPPARVEAPYGLGVPELLAGRRSDTTITAETPATILAIDAAVWWDVLEEDFSLVVHVRRSLGRAHALQAAACGAYDVTPPEAPIAAALKPATDVPEMVDRLLHLHRVAALRPFGVAVLAALLGGETERRVASGDALFRAGDEASHVLVVAGGEVECTAPDGTTPLRVGPGAMLGENTALTGLVHAHDAVAVSDAMVLAIDAHRLWDVAEDHFHVARALLAQAARRLLALEPGAVSADQERAVETRQEIA